MLECDLVKVKRDAKCRGTNRKCKCQSNYGIKAGEECLKITLSAYTSVTTAYYCKTCMFDVLSNFKKVINLIDTGIA